MNRAMIDDEIFAAFEAGKLDPKIFSHEMHVRVGWIFVCRFPPAEAMTRFADKLKAWATALKIPGKYHETITWFFMLLINERQTRQKADTFEAFIAENRDLIAKPSILERYYKRETLASDYARSHYVLPDKLEAA